MQLSQRQKEVARFMDKIASQRNRWIRRNRYYYQDLVRFFRYNIPRHAKVFEVGCGLGNLLASVVPKRGVGIDISAGMIKRARARYPQLEFHQADIENLQFKEKFNYIILSDCVGYFEDVEKAFFKLRQLCQDDTRIFITYHNFFWQPFLRLAEFLGLKMPQRKLNWLNIDDISNLLNLAGFEIIKQGKRFLFPKYVPLLSYLVNKYLAHLPLINKLCLTGFVIAKKSAIKPANNKLYSVSVIVAARNEKGNIEPTYLRTPLMGKNTEVIFIEGGSTDGTREEIKRVFQKFNGRRSVGIQWAQQDGKGKGDAVRKGVSLARGDIIMIHDADLTVPPSDLRKFYNAFAMGKGEYINGTRLVYPMEKNAMRTLNFFGNKFFSYILSWLIGQRLKDTLCANKVISKKNFLRIQQHKQYFDAHDPFGDFDLIFGASKLNLKITEVPIRYRARQYGSTNISRFSDGWLLLKMVVLAMDKIKFR